MQKLSNFPYPHSSVFIEFGKMKTDAYVFGLTLMMLCCMWAGNTDAAGDGHAIPGSHLPWALGCCAGLVATTDI